MIRFREVLPSDAEMLLGWRTSPRVASQMATTVSLNLEDQRQWLLACYDRPDYYHWVIQFQDKPVGLINLTNFSPATGETAWGFYIGDDAALGLGAFVPPYFYNFVFSYLGLHRIHAEVLESNSAVIKLHTLHGYERQPARDRVIEKDGVSQNMVAMVLDAHRWRQGRFTHMEADLPTILWEARPK